MTADELRARQGPLKERFRDQPALAQQTLEAEGRLDRSGFVCKVSTHLGELPAGLHPATGGDGSKACSAEMLLQSLVGCAGTTLNAVATSLGVNLRGGSIHAEGDIDFRGTLGVSKEADVGFQAIRLRFELDADAAPETLEKLVALTERYCVVYQTLKKSPRLGSSVALVQPIQHT